MAAVWLCLAVSVTSALMIKQRQLVLSENTEYFTLHIYSTFSLADYRSFRSHYTYVYHQTLNNTAIILGY